jgi:peptidoglycan/xylan/chitin deacetylase (PgdA/CDA1 family)
VIRGSAAALAALVTVLLPFAGGGSGSAPSRHLAQAALARLEVPAAPAPRRPRAPGADHTGLLRPTLYPRPAARVRELVLTFDDGPDLAGTPVVLDELAKRGLKAIFFVNGQHMVGSRAQDAARRDLVRRIAAQGHLVANHTLSHRNLCADIEPETLETEIDGNAEIITAATGVRPLLFRSPYGARCRMLDQALRDRSLLQVGWNLDPQEWRGDGEDAIVRYVTRRLSRFGGRLILLLHDHQREAVRALPRILDWVARENARLGRTGGTPIDIRDYSVFLPAEPLPDTGFEPVVVPILTELARAAGGIAEMVGRPAGAPPAR